MAAGQFRYAINLLDDGSVYARDGEYLGTWSEGEQGGVYDFTPDGQDIPTIFDPHIPWLCEKIEDWRASLNV